MVLVQGFGIKRKARRPGEVSVQHLKKRCDSLAIDSGAHSLYTREVIQLKHATGYDYYKSKEFWVYVDKYAKFIKKYKDGIDFYVTVDVIFNPKMTWKIQKYLENEHGLTPMPVVHYGTDLKWLRKYIDAGYKYIGIGGLGQEVTRQMYYSWADSVFNMLCDNPKRLPIIKTHAFAMTSYPLIIRWPWYSVDAATWAKTAAFGSIFIPHKRNGKFDFSEEPYTVTVSCDAGTKSNARHYSRLTYDEKKIVNEWLEFIDMPLGKVKERKGKMVTQSYGVSSEYHARAVANIRFYERLCDWLPKWPWAFKVPKKLPERMGFFQ